MSSDPDLPALLDRLRERLEEAERLAGAMRARLAAADAEGIEEATARLRTVATEYGVLARELGRLPAAGAERGADPAWDDALDRFRCAATSLARRAAVEGGVLHGLVELSRRLLDTLGAPRGDAYSADGRVHAPETMRGLRLTETA